METYVSQKALYPKPCEHKGETACTAWRQLNENTEICSVICVNCGKTVEILTRKIRKTLNLRKKA
jgi:transcription elongation factor Elf1